MLRHLGVALRISILSIIVLGILYPFAMTGIAQVIMPAQANGALVTVGGKVVGSDIIGELWTQPKYFQGRASAAGKNGYDPTATGGTDLGPTSKKLIDTTRATIASLRKANPNATVPLPMDLVASSGSGIDPDISPQAAYYQAARVASARGLPIGTVNTIIRAHIHPRTWGFLGEPRVNVLELNLALAHLR